MTKQKYSQVEISLEILHFSHLLLFDIFALPFAECDDIWKVGIYEKRHFDPRHRNRRAVHLNAFKKHMKSEKGTTMRLSMSKNGY